MLIIGRIQSYMLLIGRIQSYMLLIGRIQSYRLQKYGTLPFSLAEVQTFLLLIKSNV
jgi:hypothetical protein